MNNGKEVWGFEVVILLAIVRKCVYTVYNSRANVDTLQLHASRTGGFPSNKPRT